MIHAISRTTRRSCVSIYGGLIAVLLVILVLCTCEATAQTSNQLSNPESREKAQAVLEEAARTMDACRSLQFRFRYGIKWFSGDKVDTIDGITYLLRDNVDNPLNCKIRVERSDHDIRTFDGQDAYCSTTRTPEVQVFDTSVHGIGIIETNLPARDFVRLSFAEANAIASSLKNSDSVVYRGSELVDGERCDVVRAYQTVVDEEDGDTTMFITYWRFNSATHLLRRWDQEVQWMGQLQRKSMEWLNVRINGPILDEMFRISATEDTPLHRMRSDEFTQKPLLPAAQQAPDWTLPDPKGDSVSLHDTKGMVRVMDFWGTWCGYCIVALPELQKLQDDYLNRGVIVYGVDCREQEKGNDPVALMRRKGASYPLVMKGDSVAEQYRVTGYPTVYVIGDDGEILHAEFGFNSETKLTAIREVIDAYLKTKGR